MLFGSNTNHSPKSTSATKRNALPAKRRQIFGNPASMAVAEETRTVEQIRRQRKTDLQRKRRSGRETRPTGTTGESVRDGQFPTGQA